jgi:hypothetical protein
MSVEVVRENILELRKIMCSRDDYKRSCTGRSSLAWLVDMSSFGNIDESVWVLIAFVSSFAC